MPSDSSLMDPQVKPMSQVVDVAMAGLVRPIKEHGLSEAEYSLLRVVCFCSAGTRLLC